MSVCEQKIIGFNFNNTICYAIFSRINSFYFSVFVLSSSWVIKALLKFFKTMNKAPQSKHKFATIQAEDLLADGKQNKQTNEW